MHSRPFCPVCAAANWEVIGERTYRAADQARVSPYARKRLEVLFRVWFGNATEVTLSSVLCRACGFVCYAPRPEPADIDRKYAFLADDPATRQEIAEPLRSDQLRSRALYRYVARHIRAGATVLDFGGGNGRLMRSFVDRGHDCSLVDYSGRKLPGIRYIGPRLSEIETDRKFDLIVCSHVLEHLAEPYVAIEELRPYLARGGTLYVEVPLEIWGRAPLPVEPVTHVNYFTLDSMRTLLERAGYAVSSCGTGAYVTENGTPGLAIKALATGEPSPARFTLGGDAPAATRRLIRPRLADRMVRALRHPVLAWSEASRTLRQRMSTLPLLWRLVARTGRS